MTKRELRLYGCDYCGRRRDKIVRVETKHNGVIEVCEECIVQLREQGHLKED